MTSFDPGNRVIVALDVPDTAAGVALAARVGDGAGWVKVGLELFVAEGPAVVAAMRAAGWWIHQLVFKPYLARFAAYYYNHVPDGVITYKLDAFETGTAVFDIERGYETHIQERPWQTCTSVSQNSWGYINHHVYKEPAAILHHLVDIVTKNGCMLLNVGPKPDGTIPAEEQQILREIGRWLAVNGEAIYETRPWRVFGEGPTEIPAGQFNDNDVTFTGQDIRFTVKGDKLFAITLGDPGDAVEIKSLAGQRIRAVRMLGSSPPTPAEHGSPPTWV